MLVSTRVILSVMAVIVSAGVLVACSAELNVKSSPQSSVSQPVEIKVPNNIGLTQTISISEMCYDNVVYLVNSRGGTAPKINPNREGQFTLFVKC